MCFYKIITNLETKCNCNVVSFYFLPCANLMRPWIHNINLDLAFQYHCYYKQLTVEKIMLKGEMLLHPQSKGKLNEKG